MTKISLVLALAAYLLSSGCSRVEPVQTVDWFKEHKAERADVIAKCKENPGEALNKPNCMNAVHAEEAATFNTQGRTLKLAPLTAEQFDKKTERK